MSRRVTLPSADDLFRPTEDVEREQPAGRAGKRGAVRAVPDEPQEQPQPFETPRSSAPQEPTPASRRTSGRVKHEEKMTVYVTSAELLEIEHARLALRSTYGLAVDRGRLVREAISLVLADLAEHAGESALVRRLTEE